MYKSTTKQKTQLICLGPKIDAGYVVGKTN